MPATTEFADEGPTIAMASSPMSLSALPMTRAPPDWKTSTPCSAVPWIRLPSATLPSLSSPQQITMPVPVFSMRLSENRFAWPVLTSMPDAARRVRDDVVVDAIARGRRGPGAAAEADAAAAVVAHDEMVKPAVAHPVGIRAGG